MPPTEIVLDPAEIAEGRTELHLNTGPINIEPDGIDWGDSAIDQYLTQDGIYGSAPVDFRVPNRQITIPLLIGAAGPAGFDGALQALRQKVALIQREGGGWLKRGPGVYAELTNAFVHIPDRFSHINVEGGLVLTLEARPDFFGDEIALDLITESTAAEIATKLKLSAVDAVIQGDYPARCRIVGNEVQGQPQLGLIWGLRSRSYDAAATARLAYEAEALTPRDAAAIATVTGASGGASNNVVRHANLSTSWTPVLSTQILSGSAHMTHTGSYRIWVRAYSTSSTLPYLRLVWDVGDLLFPVDNRRIQVPGASNFYLLDLGEIRLDPAPAGTHRWQGVIQAIGDAGGENVSIDRIWFQPLEFAGSLRAPMNNSDAGLVDYSARDEFSQSAGALAGKTLPAGGTWAGAGDATDANVSGAGVVTRVALSDTDARYMLAGATTLSAVVVRARVMWTAGASISGVLARYVNITNWAAAYFNTGAGGLPPRVIFAVSVAGVSTVFNFVTPTSDFSADRLYDLRLVILPSGYYEVRAGPTLKLYGQGLLPALATGGALATGQVGLFDMKSDSVAQTRTWDDFAAWAPAPDAVLYPSQSAQLGTDGMFREDAAGAAYGPVSWVTGDLPRLPPSGSEGRAVELFLKASRGDFDHLPDNGIDDISAQVFYRPCWLNPPR